MEKFRVGIIGATGMVGQRFVLLTANHPWFTPVVLAASAHSAGKPYAEAIGEKWHMADPIPESVRSMVVMDAEADAEEIAKQVDFVFCAVNMKKDEIKALEERYAKLECPVVSNNSAHRHTPDVPMVLPEINADHIRIIDAQRKRLGTKRGFIAVKSNCSLQSYVPALHPLMKYGIEKALVCTYQAISGAGKTFDTWPEMLDNVIPYIGGEEEKSEQEPLKLWGKIEGDHIENASSPAITAQCLRVPCSDGHMAACFVSFKGEKPSIEQIKAENPHDELDMDNAGSAAMISNWRDVLAVYAVRTTTDASSPDEVATLTEEKLDILRQIFWDMNAISYWVETISGDKDESDTVILHITVTVKDHLQMADEYRFNAEQHKLLEELMQPEYQELFAALTGSYQDIELSPDEVAKIMENLPADLSEARREVVLTAYQLLGRVHYFWGGKSLVIGWDSRWGMPMEVTAEGSSTTGTVRPFGLDCSGMVDWVFYNQSGGQYVIGHGGGATAQHSYCTPIDWSDAQPGDLVFYPEDSHVGIVCGFDGSGNVLIIHCASSENNVVVTGKSGFASIGRPKYYSEQIGRNR